MKTKDTSVQKISIAAGLLVCAGLIAYFLLMKMMGLLDVLELRILNFFILLAGIIYAIKYLQSQNQENFEYFEGIAVGFLTACVSVISFGFFVFVYLKMIDPAFMQYIQENSIFGHYLTPGLAAVGIMIEGISSGAIISFACMQHFKRYAL